MIQNQTNRSRQTAPLAGLLQQLFAPLRSKRIKARFPIVFAYAPFGANPILVFQPLQGYIQRSMLDEKNFFRLPLNGSGNTLSMAGAKNQALENQQVEGSLQKGDAVVVALSG